MDPRRRAAQNYVAQGITSAAINPDGRQPPSLLQERRDFEHNGIKTAGADAMSLGLSEQTALDIGRGMQNVSGGDPGAAI